MQQNNHQMYTYRWISQINLTRTFGIFRIPKLEHFISLSLNEFLWVSYWKFFVLDCVALLSGVRTKHLFDSYFSNSILEYNLIYCKCNANTIQKGMNAKITEKDTETTHYWQSLSSFSGTERNSMYRPARNLIRIKKSEIRINSQFFRKILSEEDEFAARRKRSNCAIPDPAPMLPNICMHRLEHLLRMKHLSNITKCTLKLLHLFISLMLFCYK